MHSAYSPRRRVMPCGGEARHLQDARVSTRAGASCLAAFAQVATDAQVSTRASASCLAAIIISITGFFMFQPAPARHALRHVIGRHFCTVGFNPRRRVMPCGSRPGIGFGRRSFQPAPARHALRLAFISIPMSQVFQPAPARHALRQIRADCSPTTLCFNPRRRVMPCGIRNDVLAMVGYSFNPRRRVMPCGTRPPLRPRKVSTRAGASCLAAWTRDKSA